MLPSFRAVFSALAVAAPENFKRLPRRSPFTPNSAATVSSMSSVMKISSSSGTCYAAPRPAIGLHSGCSWVLPTPSQHCSSASVTSRRQSLPPVEGETAPGEVRHRRIDSVHFITSRHAPSPTLAWLLTDYLQAPDGLLYTRSPTQCHAPNCNPTGAVSTCVHTVV